MQLSLRWAERSRRAFDDLNRAESKPPNSRCSASCRSSTFSTMAQSIGRRPDRYRFRLAMPSAVLPSANRKPSATARSRRPCRCCRPSGRATSPWASATARGHRRGGAPRHRHVRRARDADAQRTQQPATFSRAPACCASCNARYERDTRPLDEILYLLHLAAAGFPRLSAPPGQVRRNARTDAGDDPQPALLPGSDGRSARGDSGAAAGRLRR